MPHPMDLFDRYAQWLPLLIFCARVADVSLGTFRTICVVRGQRLLAAFVGFFEVLIWLGAISSVVSRLDRPLNVLAYACGFATGNYVGMWLEAKLALGMQIVRLITGKETRMAPQLRQAGYVVTELDGEGRDGTISICFVAAYRRDVPALIEAASQIDPDMLSTVEDVRQTNFLPYHYVPQKSGLSGVLKMK